MQASQLWMKCRSASSNYMSIYLAERKQTLLSTANNCTLQAVQYPIAKRTLSTWAASQSNNQPPVEYWILLSVIIAQHAWLLRTNKQLYCGPALFISVACLNHQCLDDNDNEFKPTCVVMTSCVAQLLPAVLPMLAGCCLS
jgi:hypothetical protein